MKALSLIKKLILVTLSALIGAIVFYSFSMALFYIAKSIFPDNIAEAAPPLWIGLWLVVVLLGMGLSAVFGGFWGYSRYGKPLTHHSDRKGLHRQSKPLKWQDRRESGTPNGAP